MFGGVTFPSSMTRATSGTPPLVVHFSAAPVAMETEKSGLTEDSRSVASPQELLLFFSPPFFFSPFFSLPLSSSSSQRCETRDRACPSHTARTETRKASLCGRETLKNLPLDVFFREMTQPLPMMGRVRLHSSFYRNITQGSFPVILFPWPWRAACLRGQNITLKRKLN